ncbi:MAG: hypothetical protein J2P45_19190, partial [Candidatus Dormibacteraeota bacterium]|nr:hypothetical protein [Candidatus Dormibacteraeota bacterium]
MITIRAGEWRLKALEARRRLRETMLGLGGMGLFSGGVARMGRAVHHEIAEAQSSRPSTRPLRNSRGRRLRASAYQFGPAAASRSRPPGPGVAGTHLPGALKVVLVGVVGVISFLGGSSAYINFAGDLPDVHAIGD